MERNINEGNNELDKNDDSSNNDAKMESENNEQEQVQGEAREQTQGESQGEEHEQAQGEGVVFTDAALTRDDAQIEEKELSSSENNGNNNGKGTETVTVAKLLNMGNLDRNFAPRPDEWSEPIVKEKPETTSGMYTPGISVEQSASRRRSNIDPGNPRPNRENSTRSNRSVRALFLVLICAIASALSAYGVMEFRFNRGDFTVVNHVVLGGSYNGQQNAGISDPLFASNGNITAEDIYDMACNQVVSISTKYEYPGGFYSGMNPSSSNTESGSGFIISSDGYILTNYHVVETSYKNNLPLIVMLNDWAEYEATVMGYDINNDVALIKIEATGLSPVIIANSDNIKVGQTVYAVGNPLGELVYTMTDGIVSARDREVSVDGKTINTFQFSAAVNSGNSGGPLYNSLGEVIGIVTAKPRTASVEGIGFAIPINDAIEIAMELIEFGYITGRPLMGITVQNVTSANAAFYDWVIGVWVMSVLDNSAAERAGILVGDIITSLGEVDIETHDELTFNLRKYKAGDTTNLIIWRDGEYIELSITLDEDLSAGQAR